MRLLDLFCGAGGAAMGYHRSRWNGEGFDEIVGVDINPQPHYPFKFVLGDVFDVEFDTVAWEDFDFIHASPPCQAYTRAQTIQNRQHPRLIGLTRARLQNSGTPYVIENVPGARSSMIDPVEFCGQRFGLGTYRHRLFETSFPVSFPTHEEHLRPIAKMGRRPEPKEMMHVVGHFTGVKQAREAMDIDWMTRDELSEAVPPAYTEYIGTCFLAAKAAA